MRACIGHNNTQPDDGQHGRRAETERQINLLVHGHCGAVYFCVQTVFYSGNNLAAGKFTEPGAKADDSLWWRHERLHRMALKNLTAAGPAFLAERNAFEDESYRAEQRTFNKPAAQREKFSADVLAKSDALLIKWTAQVSSTKLKSPFHPLYRRYWKKQNAKAGVQI
jgi:hypothetical protein